MASLRLKGTVFRLVQTSGGERPDAAEPGGELRSTWGSADQTGNPHHPPLRRQRPGRLANTAEEPARHGGVGGKCSSAIKISVPMLNSQCQQTRA